MTTLGKGESALAVTIGDGWGAVATDRGFLRVFRETNVQMVPIMLPGDVIAMAGNGKHLAMAFHASSGDHISFALYDCNPDPIGQRTAGSMLPVELCRGTIPLTPTAELAWIVSC